MSRSLPADATWTDYVKAHGGPDKPGWWVTLCWYAGQEPRPEAIGPYPTHQQAISAMQASCLIDGLAEDTKNPEWLDDVYVAAEPASITQTCAAYANRVTVIDPGDPDHFGVEGIDSSPAPGATTLQAGALHTPPPPQAIPDVDQGDRLPGPGRTF